MDLTPKNHSTLRALVYLALSLSVMVSFYLINNKVMHAPARHQLLARAATSDMMPILPLATSASVIPFFPTTFRDPQIISQRPDDSVAAERLTRDINDWRNDLTRSQGERAAELHLQIYQACAALSYYIEDVLNGTLSGDGASVPTLADLTRARTQMLQHAMAFSKTAKNGGAKAQALYHLNTTLYLMGQNRAVAVERLKELSKQKLSSTLKQRANLLVAYANLQRGQNRPQALATLKANSAGLSPLGAIAMHFVAAKSLVDAGSDAYRAKLLAATSRAARLPKAQKEVVFSYAVGIWRRADQRNWANPPFNLNHFSDLVSSQAIIERSALEDWRAGKITMALRKYNSISQSLNGSVPKAGIDLRILDLKRQEYLTSTNAKPYAQALTMASKTYLDPGILGIAGETLAKQTAQNIKSRYKALIYGELTRGGMPNTAKPERSHAITLAQEYLVSVYDAGEIETVKAKIANLYVLNNAHGQAVNLYRDLAETNHPGRARQYLMLAIASQSVLAAWPTQVPWVTTMNSSHAPAREVLLSFYQKLHALPPSQPDWFVLGHTGLLEITLGRPEAAFTAWEAGLKISVSGKHAANAAGFMLVAHQKVGDWDKLEKLARLCTKSQILAQYREKPLNVQEFLALALLEGGKQALSSQNYAVAVTKLGEFVKKFPGAKNHDQGFYLLASAYRGDQQYTLAIKTLVAFVEKYPRSSYYRPALLSGGDWSAPLAFEENAMFFYAKFATEYSRDQEANRVRDTLKNLYLGRGFYAEAVAVLSAQAQAPGLAAENRVKVLAEILAIEDREGSNEKALVAADVILRTPAADADTKAAALALKARHFVTNRRYNEVQRIAGQLSELTDTGFAAQDALGEVRYLLAVEQGKHVIKTYFNLSLQDPLATMNQRYEAFNGAMNAYKAVCAAGQTSFCAPALHRFARLSEDFLKSLEDIEIQTTLAQDVVRRFQSRKQTILNDVTRASQSADDRSLAILSEGNTHPNWTQAVLWHNTSDADFNRVSGDSGNGYVQWSE